MKNLLLISLLMTISFACSKKDAFSPNSEKKNYTVRIGFSGEITESKSPLSKNNTTTIPRAVTSNDLMGIQVYSRVQGTTGAYNPFAYGVFDNATNLSLSLLEGYEYKFVATIVVDGKGKIYQTNEVGFWDPFFAKLENKFIVSTVEKTQLRSGSAHLKTIDNYFYSYGTPNVDRYYGETAGYIPTVNGTVTIDTKRTVFGAKFVATGLTDGQLKMEIRNAPIQYISTTTPSTTIQDIFTFSAIPAAWANDTYTETIPVTVTWIKSDGAVVPLGTKNIAFERNMLSTININVGNTSSASSVAVTQESTPMGVGSTITF